MFRTKMLTVPALHKASTLRMPPYQRFTSACGTASFFSASTASNGQSLIHSFDKVTKSSILHKNLKKASLFTYDEASGIPKENGVEAAFQNLCNLVFLNPITGRFDPELLPESIQPNKRLLALYAKNNFSADHTNSLEAARAFWDVVSFQCGLSYFYYTEDVGNHGLYVEAANFLNVMNHLFGTHAKNFQQLSAALSTPERQISFTEALVSEQKNTSVINIHIKSQIMGDTEIKFTSVDCVEAHVDCDRFFEKNLKSRMAFIHEVETINEDSQHHRSFTL